MNAIDLQTEVRKLPLVSKAMLFVLPFSYVLSFAAPYSLPHHAAFIPANTVLTHMYLWNVWTQVLVDVDLGALMVSWISLWLCLKPAEESLGSERLVIMLALVLLASCGWLIILSALVYGTLGWFWLYQSFSGFLPAAVSASVALAHVTQGCTYAVSSSVLPMVRTKHIPLLLLLSAGVRDVWTRWVFETPSDAMTEMDIGSQEEIFEAPMLPMAGTTFFLTWFLIRFFGVEWLRLQRSSSSGPPLNPGGDASPQFALAEFFYPQPVSACVSTVSAFCFPMIRLMGLGADIDTALRLQSVSAATEVTIDASQFSLDLSKYMVPLSAAGPGGLAPLPGSSVADAERRRAIALAALTARLQQVHGGGGGSDAPVSEAIDQNSDLTAFDVGLTSADAASATYQSADLKGLTDPEVSRQ